jgi:DNA polymerase II small subunit/DNA polymerase delta subunit B
MKFGASFWSDVFLCVHSSTWCQVTKIHKLVSFKTTGKTVTRINLEVTIK